MRVHQQEDHTDRLQQASADFIINCVTVELHKLDEHHPICRQITPDDELTESRKYFRTYLRNQPSVSPRSLPPTPSPPANFSPPARRGAISARPIIGSLQHVCHKISKRKKPKRERAKSGRKHAMITRSQKQAAREFYDLDHPP